MNDDVQTEPRLQPFKPTAVPRTAHSFARVRIDHLWVLIILVGIGVCISLSATPPNDFWWHLKAGQIVATEGIPTTNLFAWTLPADHPYIYATWLGEWAFYQLYALGGLSLVVLARNLLGLAAFALVALEARRRTGSWRWAALAALLAAAMSLNNLIIRTQNWSWLPFGLFMVILGAYAAGQVRARVLLALPLLMVFWVNAHGGYALGLIMLGTYVAGETLRVLLRHSGALPWGRLRALYMALVGTVAATLVNPLGFGIFTYVQSLLNDPSSQQLIVEWQSPDPREFIGRIFFASVLLLLVALAYARRRPTVTDVLLLMVFLWMAWTGQRYVMWFGMIAMPILVQCLATPRTAPVRLPRPTMANTLFAGMLLLALVAFQPPFKERLPLPESYNSTVVRRPGVPLAFNHRTPFAATDYLLAHPREGRLFNEMGYGSYLAWALYPQMQSFIDPRVELYPFELWQDYIAISEARDYNALLIDTYDVTTVMLDVELQPKLAEALQHDTQHWTREYADARTAIYRRNE